ncbi:MAG: ATP-binding cassette domain-containing protein [Candidatus Hydrogenedentes bacterium]|nr:ATP-binding cassette domain-containing protein [Candidatus Hydrogenedentota bacterium]
MSALRHPETSDDTILEVQDLKVHFPVVTGALGRRRHALVKAVDGVSLTIRKGEVVGVVGESGCGKTTLARAILQLVPAAEGQVLYLGRDLARLGRGELREMRPELQMIFQDPYASLNPRMTVFDTIAEPLRIHRVVPSAGLTAEVARVMQTVGLAPRFMRKYPHEFSGGQRQRIAIARALATRPHLIVADEPVSALDVSVQAQILNLLKRLSREMGLTMILIAHDLAVVRHMAQRVAVMYLGRIVELGDTDQIFARPLHPYTQALLNAIPLADPDAEAARTRQVLQGDPPSPIAPPDGCAFHPRCPHMHPECRLAVPALAPWHDNQRAACIRLDAIHGD